MSLRSDFMAQLESDSKRFWSKVEKTDDCWNWIASKNERGYGTFGVQRDGRWGPAKARRVSYEVAYGKIPEGAQVDHQCRNRACVRPDHLRLVNHKENQENLAAASASTSGIRGVSWSSRNRKWLAKVTHNGKQVHVGLFDNIASAESAVIAKRNELFTHNDADRGEAA